MFRVVYVLPITITHEICNHVPSKLRYSVFETLFTDFYMPIKISDYNDTETEDNDVYSTMSVRDLFECIFKKTI